jgi:phosphoribosylformylglycinamidine synthase
MESHNHPSFIEPYQGAATGVGGILRDVFTMGARPIANLNALRFGAPDHPKTKSLVAGVVAGIGGYGNCVGVPTVGGECEFDAAYNGNILVNAMTIGVAKADRIFYSTAAGIGNPVVYVGSKTGRDGIHGASMASAEFDDESEAKRPTVQVGDPFAEKLLIEACLELMATDAIVAIQDMGAAGLTSSAFEMAGKGGLGLDFQLDKVPMREQGMTPYELMLSESQERMLMVLKPGEEATAGAIFEKWRLDFAIVGALTATGRMRLYWHGDLAGDLPIQPLSEAAPEYDRPYEIPASQPKLDPGSIDRSQDIGAALLKLIGGPNLASRRWIWEQYDSLVRGDTIRGPGGDAALVRLGNGPKGIAATSDCSPRYCFADPITGGRQAVAEAWRNLVASGAKPLAVTDNLNFGNPEKPEIMGQFVGCIQGMGEACRALDFPVVSGNVSLYNETNGVGILPTPTIGAIGLVDDVAAAPSIALQPGLQLVLVGKTEGWLGASRYLAEIEGRSEGAPPPVDLSTERKNGEIVSSIFGKDLCSVCHDVSGGGLLVAIAKMAMAGGIGAEITVPAAEDAYCWLFGEDQARYLLAVDDAETVLTMAEKAGVAAQVIGATGGDTLTVAGLTAISLSDLASAHEGWLPEFMAGA